MTQPQAGPPAEPGTTRLWGARFDGGPSTALANLSVSVHFDWQLATYDLAASRAHARVLHRGGLLDDDELAAMIGALEALEGSVRDGTFRPSVADEDVHTALERGLLEHLGPLGGKLRAGRSRNDQVATDFRLYLRDAMRHVAAEVAGLSTALIEVADRHRDVAMPGMTGVDLARQIRSEMPDLPIIFASGYADVQTFGEELLQEDMLKKPYRLAELAARISAALAARPSGGNVVSLRG